MKLRWFEKTAWSDLGTCQKQLLSDWWTCRCALTCVKTHVRFDFRVHLARAQVETHCWCTLVGWHMELQNNLISLHEQELHANVATSDGCGILISNAISVFVESIGAWRWSTPRCASLLVAENNICLPSVAATQALSCVGVRATEHLYLELVYYDLLDIVLTSVV